MAWHHSRKSTAFVWTLQPDVHPPSHPVRLRTLPGPATALSLQPRPTRSSCTGSPKARTKNKNRRGGGGGKLTSQVFTTHFAKVCEIWVWLGLLTFWVCCSSFIRGRWLSCVGSHSPVGLRFLERGNKILHHPCPLSPDQRHFIFPAECGLKQGRWHRLGAWAPCYGSIPQASASGNSFL